MNMIRQQRKIIDRLAVVERLEAILSPTGYKPELRADLVAVMKVVWQDGYAEVRARFEASGDGQQSAVENSFLVDQLVRIIFDMATWRVYRAPNLSKAEKMSVIAVGGYGRGRLAPFSDVDLLFLLPYKETPFIEQVVEFMLYMLWDMGLKVGHATRSIGDCMRLAKSDVTIQTSLLDARWLWGDQELFAEFTARFKAELTERGGNAFVEAKLAERNERHERMGDTRYVVEPNIKEGKGGLRDLQTLYWLVRHLYGVDRIDQLAEHEVFTEQDISRYSKARDFLWTVRCHLHYLSGRAEERLTFDVQKTIGEAMGYAGDRAGISAVERFMKHYFLIAKNVGDLTRVLCAVLEEQHKKRTLFRLPGLQLRRVKVDGFITDGGRINVENDHAFKDDPIKLLSIFKQAHEHDLDIHPQALHLITHNLHLINKDLRENPEANGIFMDILISKKDPEIALRRLNESDVFGRFIPDFGRIVAQMQYNMYHTYTVDEHTIRAIGILARLENNYYQDEMPNMTKAVTEIRSRRALFTALLIHDIAKGRGGDHSELGAEVALGLCPRLGLDDEETETVSWLILNHLLMSDTAFKRDIDDGKTIRDFVNIVQSVERLRLLSVLTVADIRAVGPNTWNNWKSGLLRGLFQRALEILSGDRVMENRAARIEAAKQDLRERLADWPGAELEEHIATGYPGYWLAYDIDTHARHAEIVREAKDRNLDLHIDTRHDEEFEYTEVTVYTPDHPGLFSKIAGAMALSGANIMDAKIVTFADGMALDSFSFLDATDKAYASPVRLERLWTRIEDVIAGKIRLDAELAKAGGARVAAREQAFRVAPRVLIDNQASNTDTVIEVNGRDRVGFLYDVTAALYELGLKISSAHVTTYGERVVDSFYVKDVFGLKVEHDDKLKVIQARLLDALKQTAAGEGEDVAAAE
ncbi:MAG: [protein-PII] uridylyltransferase [Rhodospirillales bacterium]|jgi:[protein-PII] uridylyltransferase|nr:[protein-PII] uridylyltransferase [Rhodospirillales bacterium]MDP6642622.1 [protein-PII] uridylyltransferase [Rhodospirillales bacterium]MDP6840550.1 [protein-PII] uridylyltransferase [Rhodospirillales bacterium]